VAMLPNRTWRGRRSTSGWTAGSRDGTSATSRDVKPLPSCPARKRQLSQADHPGIANAGVSCRRQSRPDPVDGRRCIGVMGPASRTVVPRDIDHRRRVRTVITAPVALTLTATPRGSTQAV
jgi:hypothetical protein